MNARARAQFPHAGVGLVVDAERLFAYGLEVAELGTAGAPK